MANCKFCMYWKNEQRQLNYWEDIGFCTNPAFKFNTDKGRLIGIYDNENLVNVSGNPSHNIETGCHTQINKSRYLIVTEAKFGCIFHTSKPKNK